MGNILIVDDEEDICFALKRLLQEEGYEVKTAVNCSEVANMLEEEYFDTIITELFLSEEDGFQVLETVQQIDEDLPFIMIIDRDNENIAIQALEMGAYDYIYKPMIYTDIVNTVYRAVDKRTLFVDKVNAEDELEVTSWKLNCLISIIESFSNVLDEEEAAEKILKTLMKNYSATYCSLSFLEENGKTIKIVAEKTKYNCKGDYKIGQSYPVDIFPITKQVIETKKIIVESGIIDLSSEISLKLKQETGNEIFCSFMEIPVIYMEKVLGLLHIKSHNEETRIFTEHEVKVAETIAKYIGIVVDNIRFRTNKG